MDKEACGSMDCQSIECERNPNCYFKQLARKTKECEKMKYYLEKIRADELSFLDIDEDDYFANCNDTNYSNIITYVEYALGENEDE